MSNNPFRIDKKNNQSGFSLVELVIVVALIAILMSIAIPRLPMSSNRELKLATQKLISNIRLIRSESIASGSECKITLFINEGYYIVTLTDDSKRVYLPEGITFLRTNITTKDEKNDNRPYIYFSELGRPNVSGSIWLQTEDEEIRSITLIMATGRVKVTP